MYYYLHVDSKNRDTNLYPHGNTYVLHVPTTIKNVIKADLVSARVPNTMYNLTNGTNVFSTSSLISPVSMNPGFYSAQLLADEINERLNIREAIQYSQAEGKFLYLTNESTSTITINSTELAKMLGLQVSNTYTVSPLDVAISGFSYAVKSEKVVDFSLNEYVFLDIEEFRSPFFSDAKSMPLSGTNAGNMFAAIPMDVPSTHVKNFKENTDYEVSIDVNPRQTLSRLTVHWYDKDLKPLNFRGFDNNGFILRLHTDTVTAIPNEHMPDEDMLDSYIKLMKDRVEQEASAAAAAAAASKKEKIRFGKWFLFTIVLALLVYWYFSARVAPGFIR